MAKNQYLNDDALKLAKYRWEFLRRNQDYRKDYFDYVERRKQYYENENNFIDMRKTGVSQLISKSSDSDSHPDFDLKAKLCGKWKLTTLYNPDSSFDDMAKIMAKTPLTKTKSMG